jgi:hypothetical protein
MEKWHIIGDMYPEIKSESGVSIAALNTTFIEKDVYQAHAKLIAAAPEMLEMLIHCEKIFKQGGGMEYTLSDIQSLIKKATE